MSKVKTEKPSLTQVVALAESFEEDQESPYTVKMDLVISTKHLEPVECKAKIVLEKSLDYGEKSDVTIDIELFDVGDFLKEVYDTLMRYKVVMADE